MNEAMVKVSRKGSGSKVMVISRSSIEEAMSLNSDLDLPGDSEDTTTILSEMAAQKAVFDAAFTTTPNRERVLSCSQLTLNLLPYNPEPIETRLLVFCLSYCIGNVRSDLIPEKTSEKRWTRKVFEALSIGWMRWMVDQNDDGVLFYIANMHNDEPKGEDKSFDTLILNFWSKAIELMVLNRPSEAKKFFDRANEVGAQIGTSINPSICWTYATSFYRLTGTR
jgi:hypothetical protein